MGWVRLDDNFADHPKIIGLSDKAFRLFITGLCYANRQLTDGVIPYRLVNAWVGDDIEKPTDDLEDQELWVRVEDGFYIRSYEEYQPTREKVKQKQILAQDRLKRYRERNASETQMKRHPQPNPTQPNPNKKEVVVIDEKEEEPTTTTSMVIPRNLSARTAVMNISQKLADARAKGHNAWNLSKLVEAEWDKLHANNDIGGCIALTTWYVSELQSRKLTRSEYGRIGQMTKRFGRIALLAIDYASSRDLDDLCTYAFKVAQKMYAEKAKASE